jgi:ABC-type transport system substrate-binding protein
MTAAIGVSAPDDATLVIELNFPASYFLSMTPMWTLVATPQWAIEEHEESWTEAGNIVTSGRYVLSEWVHNVQVTVLRNPLMPEDMRGSGNIERRIVRVVPDTSTGYALWLNNEVDNAGIPAEELETHLADFSDETIQVPDLAVFYMAFRMTKAPFDDVHVRRAFSAAFDRATFVTEVRQGQGLPMQHFAPPGIFGAPPIDEVGVGFDPEFAAAELEAAGYPNCEGFPAISILGYSGQSTLDWIEYAQAQWTEHLGCSADQMTIEQLPFSELLAATTPDTPDAESPHIWTLGWGPDYDDENNWVVYVLPLRRIRDRIEGVGPRTEDDLSKEDRDVRVENRRFISSHPPRLPVRVRGASDERTPEGGRASVTDLHHSLADSGEGGIIRTRTSCNGHSVCHRCARRRNGHHVLCHEFVSGDGQANRHGGHRKNRMYAGHSVAPL